MQTATEYLRELIHANGGSISVERFMQEALYHPRHGYYSRRVRDIGAGGDFSTSVTLHPALPRAVADWVLAHRAEVRSGSEWHLIELGGGNGGMAAGVLGALGWLGRRGLTYHLVEISEGLRLVQQEQTRRFARRVRWHDDICAALRAAKGKALIVSNEFVDAFPCVQLRRDETAASGWQEVAVSWPVHAPEPRETFLPWQPSNEAWPSCAAISMHEHPFAFPTGQKVEVHLAFQRWLKTLAAHWRGGSMLTIDYGDVFPDLYQRQPRGTLRGYLHHQRTSGPAVFQYFGRQDLTADVNFSDLRNWGSELGITARRLDTQANFLRRHLSAKWLARADHQEALAFLLDENGAGSAFKVLEQSGVWQ